MVILRLEWFLVGESSGAEATVTNLRLISDLSADLFGSFYIPRSK